MPAPLTTTALLHFAIARDTSDNARLPENDAASEDDNSSSRGRVVIVIPWIVCFFFFPPVSQVVPLLGRMHPEDLTVL